MESLNCSTNVGPHRLLRFKKEKVYGENLNLGYYGGLERRSSDTYQKTELFFNGTLCIMCFNSIKLNYTYHCIISSAIQKHLVIVILSVKKIPLVYCKTYVSEIQYRNDTSQNVMNLIKFYTYRLIFLSFKHHQLLLKSIIWNV